MEKELPNGWVETDLGAILKLRNGYAFKSEDFKDSGVPVIRISNIQNELVQIEEAAKIDLSKIKQEFIVRKGDILIAMSGATTGKYGIYNEEDVALQNQRVGNLVPYDESLTSRKFILYLLGGLKREIEEKAYGGAQPNISPKLIEEIKIWLPPLPEQQRIVAKLDTLLGQLDRIKASMERIPQLLKDFRQKVLTQAVTGKLTEEWREGRELEEMKNLMPLIRIQLETSSKESGKKIKYNDSSFTDELPGVPQSWFWTRLINVAEIIGGVTKGRKLDGKKTVLIPYLRVANVQDGYLDLNEIKEIEVLPSDLSKYELQNGDILFTEGGDRDKLGRGTLWRNEIHGCIHQNHIFRARVPKKFIIPEYISFFTKGDIAKKYFFENANQTINLASINLTTLSNVPIALPTYEEQQEIVRRVESLFAKADRIEASYQKIKAKLEQLPQALLAKAFRGELVEQLPTDGDARELLEQIRKLKEEGTGKVKGLGTGKGRGKKLVAEEDVRMVADDGARYGK